MTPLSSGSRCWSAPAGVSAANPQRQKSAARSAVRGRCSSDGEPLAQPGKGLIQGEVATFAVAALTVFETLGLESALRHHHAVRNAEQLRVGELDSGPRVAVVVQHFDA